MSRYPNRGVKQFTQSEKIAYHGGRAWALGKEGKRVSVKGSRNQQSFRNGVNAARAGMRGSNSSRSWHGGKKEER